MAPRDLLIGSFHAALEALDAATLLPPHLPAPPAGRTVVVGAGKAAAAMAAAVEAHWPVDAPLEGLVITRHGHGLPTRRIRVAEAGHPLPDAASEVAARELLALVRAAGPDDLVLALVSGGGSSLLTLPAEGLDLADVTAVSHALLRSGAPIADINRVRKHLSRTLGGRLAEACRAPVIALIVSDVAGDDPATIASGPFAPDPSTWTDAMTVLSRWGVAPPEAVRRHLERGARGEIADTPKPGAACFARVENRVVAGGRTALLGAAEFFAAHGITPVILGDTVEGEAREVAAVFAALAREIRLHGSPWAPPVALLSGGETSVTVRGGGQGGRNAEFALALALRLDGLEGVHALAADTDGIDGTADNAGALIGPDSLERARALRQDARARLEDNDAHCFFAALGDLLVTGPTRTNANDYRAILIA
ncbi:MAG: glycerate kinase [Thiobacillaceae bacterium]|nr:glycerate kinase [Thiobacillaceae bacterium]